MSRWHYLDCGEESAPLTLDQLREEAMIGRVVRTTSVRQESSQRWETAEAIPGLYEQGPDAAYLFQRNLATVEQSDGASSTPVYIYWILGGFVLFGLLFSLMIHLTFFMVVAFNAVFGAAVCGVISDQTRRDTMLCVLLGAFLGPLFGVLVVVLAVEKRSTH